MTPLIAAIFGKPDFSNLFLTLNKSKIMYGDFLNAVIAFLLIASVVFFFVVQPVNKFLAFSQRNKSTEDSTEKKCPQCLSTIPSAAKRCAFCTSQV
jgi:large conductance mechanosensitive channel